MNKLFPPYLEWEILREPVTISKVEDTSELPKGKKKISINRDEEYKLKATIHFEDPFPRSLYRQAHHRVAGSFADLYDIKGSSNYAVYTIESAALGGFSFTEMMEDKKRSYTAKLNFSGLKINYNNENEGTHLLEWYINGPRDCPFSRATERKVSKIFTRERYESKGNKIDSIETSNKSFSFRGDFLRIKLHDFQFLVASVPELYEPKWSSNIGIEYRKSWGYIPDSSEREKIEELCSFIFGRQLLSVGYTLLDQSEKIVEGYAHNPWGDSARSFYSIPDIQPIRLDQIQSKKTEDIIGQLLPKYYEIRNSICLKEALWNYWVSRRMPIGTKLPILTAALESIINGWFNSNKTKSKGAYMKNKEFQTLLKEEIDEIKKKLLGKTNGEEILKKILNAYTAGTMERYRIFFGEIDMPLDDNEWEAIKERHIFVHGRALFDTTDWKSVANHVWTLETLLHKVILKLLSYSGLYIDRSSIGWKDHEIK